MANQTSSLFLQNLTQIDYAMLGYTTGIPMGGSYQLSAKISGTVDQVENVVVDFSAIKKTIKDLIDDPIQGFDHKIWYPVIKGGSEFRRTSIAKAPRNQVKVDSENGFRLIAPSNAVRHVLYSRPKASIDMYLQRELEKIYPGIGIQVSTSLSVDMYIPESMRDTSIFFRYTHGLKNSTSWGCQNIAHGHLSWISVCDDEGKGIVLSNLDKFAIESKFKNAVFAWTDNVVVENDTGTLVGYHCDRGSFEAWYYNGANIIKMDKETTIENIAEWFVGDFFTKQLKRLKEEKGASYVYISEGLAKGSFIKI